MRQLTKINSAIAAVGLSTVLFMGQSYAENSTTTDAATNSSTIMPISVISILSAQNDASSSNNSNLNNKPVNSDTINNNNNNINKDNTKKESINGNDSINNNPTNSPDISPVTKGVSQKLTSTSETATSLNKFLPTIKYNTENLSKMAQQVNAANWTAGANIDRITGTKLQALLNWHQSGVGVVDGYWGKNTRKAMQAFQKAQGLAVTDTLNEETWKALTKNARLAAQPVLVNYKLNDNDIYIKTTTIPTDTKAKAKLEGMYYESVLEGLAEKFHMSEQYIIALNPNTNFDVGETITVYNPGKPNTKSVSRVVADKTTQTLYAYDDKNTLIASYPTTVGSIATPSPTGTHKVKVKVYQPNYTYTHDDGSKSIIPMGPNNPVGSVWIGLSKPSYGIHGSPDPERISRQASAGCVRLTNWDALALLGTIKDDAVVEFK
ncbi:L,D-transpeptidase family protein [Psychrobacter sp. CAL346-MNA-CIBAN-0220]|uniref:L,D-transpeptidase family protein n=1 Tax=Psychrobacter sp. CAL346-MNA-CIBAN-0220 TaxID=3140457 RepID=UPI003316D2B5